MLRWLCVLTPIVVVGCAGARGPEIGASARKVPSSKRGGLEEATGRPGSEVLPAYKTTFAKWTAEPFVSRGHADGRWNVEIWANDEGRRALEAGAKDVPRGARVVAEHTPRAPNESDGQTPVVMMMEKMPSGYDSAHGDWRYLVVGARGNVVADGTVASCAGCHDHAPSDGFFPTSVPDDKSGH